VTTTVVTATVTIIAVAGAMSGANIKAIQTIAYIGKANRI